MRSEGSNSSAARKLTASPVAVLADWISVHERTLSDLELRSELTVPSKPDVGANVDLVGTKVLARVSVWPTWLADFEILDFDSGRQLAWEHVDEFSPANMDAWLRKVAAFEGKAFPSEVKSTQFGRTNYLLSDSSVTNVRTNEARPLRMTYLPTSFDLSYEWFRLMGNEIRFNASWVASRPVSNQPGIGLARNKRRNPKTAKTG